ELLVARGGRLIGAIDVADSIRPEAGAAVRALHGMGITTILLTGDREVVAKSVASELGIGDVQATLLPDDKLEALDVLLGTGRVVAMVGDGRSEERRVGKECRS